MISIPENYIHKYASTFWSHDSLPELVLGIHASKPGVYGSLSVMQGAVSYQVFSAADAPMPDSETRIEAGAFWVMTPDQWQRIAPLTEDSYFMIDFFADPEVKLQGFGLNKVLNVVERGIE
ncbi:cytoplasmic protein [Candidatus Symbiopectobacterium sp. 'North America']|nr:cytoplasmic protein [Candidatus Symbiopectobacterium sp. 'North America']